MSNGLLQNLFSIYFLLQEQYAPVFEQLNPAAVSCGETHEVQLTQILVNIQGEGQQAADADRQVKKMRARAST